MFSKIALVSVLATAALAVPKVTIKELLGGCSSYPKCNVDTGITGPWIIQVVNNDNPAIEGFGNTDVYSISYNPITDRKPSLRWGYITLPTQNDLAKTPLECTNNTINALVPTDLTAAGAPTAVKWSPLALSPYPNDGVLLWKVAGEPVKIYKHNIDEEKQPGVFLEGYNGTTTWGFKYCDANQGSYDLPYFSMRLLSADVQLSVSKTKGFVKICA